MSEFTDQLRQPSGHTGLDDERRRAAEEIERLQTLLAGAKSEFQWPARLSVCWVAPDGHALGFYVDGKWAGDNIEDAWLKLGEKARGE